MQTHPYLLQEQLKDLALVYQRGARQEQAQQVLPGSSLRICGERSGLLTQSAKQTQHQPPSEAAS